MCETKLTPMQMSEVSKRLRIESYFAVNRNGKGGGLAMLWNDSVNVNINSFSSHHIDANVQSEEGNWMR